MAILEITNPIDVQHVVRLERGRVIGNAIFTVVAGAVYELNRYHLRDAINWNIGVSFNRYPQKRLPGIAGE